MSERLTAYLGSPDGFSEARKAWHYEHLRPMLDRYIDVHDPWDFDYSHVLELPLGSKERHEAWMAVGGHHLDVITTKDLFIGILDEEPPDAGTLIEASWAAADDRPVIGYRSDIRTNGEDGEHYNIMIGTIIERSGGLAVVSMAELEVEVSRRAAEWDAVRD